MTGSEPASRVKDRVLACVRARTRLYGPTLAEIEGETGARGGAVSVALQHLRREGLVTRRPGDSRCWVAKGLNPWALLAREAETTWQPVYKDGALVGAWLGVRVGGEDVGTAWVPWSETEALRWSHRAWARLIGQAIERELLT